jgi:hypothetical protein
VSHYLSVPSLALAARRLHDAGYSGWLQLLAVAAVLLLGFAIGGCSADDPPVLPPASSPATQPPSPVPPSPTRSTPAAGDDVAACSDGRCRLEVREPTEIPLDDDLGVRGLTVSVLGDDRVLAVAEGGAVQTGGSVGSRLTLNGRIRIEVVSVRDGVAVISMTPV